MTTTWVVIALVAFVAVMLWIRRRRRGQDVTVLCGTGHPVQLRLHGHIGTLYIDLSTGDRWIKVGEQEDEWSIVPEDLDAT